MKTIKKILLSVVAPLLLAGTVFFLGPRVDTNIVIEPVSLPDDLDNYLTQQEAAFNDITPGTEKEIIWAGEAGAKTEIAIVYLHGFSATHKETAPLAEELGRALNANVFNTRFTGHGRSNDAMAEASVNAWANDTVEAFEIGKRLGNKVILFGVSTGSTLATWLATQNPEQLTGLVLMSPNYGPYDPNSEILALPWGEQIANAAIGPQRSWQPQNEEHAKYWTYQYPTSAVLPVMGIVNVVRDSNLENITAPVQMIYSENDTVINVSKAIDTYMRIGSDRKEALIVNHSEDASQHVLAGDILAPKTTQDVLRAMLGFVSSL